MGVEQSDATFVAGALDDAAGIRVVNHGVNRMGVEHCDDGRCHAQTLVRTYVRYCETWQEGCDDGVSAPPSASARDSEWCLWPGHARGASLATPITEMAACVVATLR